MSLPDGVIKWTGAQVRRAAEERCHECDMASNRRNTRAVVLAIVIGFDADGGGHAHLRPVCALHARGHNVVPCVGPPSDSDPQRGFAGGYLQTFNK